ncbi:hypothetical protein DFP72DRAFT_1164566 [Ephemerocybe angulata]|uniref:HMG box domain-containing protein n=1 Tax=Ephemerocybe angulata TaxID=980116 RepID=A0A8H6IED1_9AGAR|nr:hypothetical protein DFP72DRAFT_1164566 [Tulosesus angulatus]
MPRSRTSPKQEEISLGYPSMPYQPCSPLGDFELFSPYQKPKPAMYSTDFCGVPLSKSFRRHGSTISARDLPFLSTQPLVQQPAFPPSPPSSTTSSTIDLVVAHIRRPPNAFMIYRSDLIKSGRIPAGVEHRQQHFSKLAGQCWNLLTETEKDVYRAKAQEALEEHQRTYPNYKFKPSPRGSRRSKTKNNSDADSQADRLRGIREKYVGITGPTLTAARNRKRKPSEAGGVGPVRGRRAAQPQRKPRPYVLPDMKNPGLTFSESSSPDSLASPMTLSENSASSHPSPNSFPALLSSSNSSAGGDQVPVFANPFSDSHYSSSNVFGLSDVLQGLDITAKALPEAPVSFISPFAPPSYFDAFSAPYPYGPVVFQGSPEAFTMNIPFLPQPNFAMHFRSLTDDTSFSRSPSPSPYEAFDMVNNPSEDINFAVTYSNTTSPCSAPFAPLPSLQ